MRNKRKIILVIFLPIVIILGWYVMGDKVVYTEKACREYVNKDILGNARYPATCLREAYFPIQKNLSESREACMYDVQPLPANKEKCPPVQVIVDATSGEVWIEKMGSK